MILVYWAFEFFRLLNRRIGLKASFCPNEIKNNQIFYKIFVLTVSFIINFRLSIINNPKNERLKDLFTRLTVFAFTESLFPERKLLIMNSFVFIHNMLTPILNWIEMLNSRKNPAAKAERELDAYIQVHQNQLKKMQGNLHTLDKQIEEIQEDILLKEKERDAQTGNPQDIPDEEMLALSKILETLNEKRVLTMNYINSIQKLIDSYNAFKNGLISNMSDYQLNRIEESIISNVGQVFKNGELLHQWNKDHASKPIHRISK